MLTNYKRRNLVKLLLDLVLLSSAFIFSFMIRFEGDWQKYFKIRYVAYFLIIYTVLNFALKISKKSWRYTDSLDVFNIICVVVLSNMIHALGVVMLSLSKEIFKIDVKKIILIV